MLWKSLHCSTIFIEIQKFVTNPIILTVLDVTEMKQKSSMKTKPKYSFASIEQCFVNESLFILTDLNDTGLQKTHAKNNQPNSSDKLLLLAIVL